MFPRSCHIAEQQIVICIFDYNKIVVHSNYFIHSKCSKLTSKFYKSQVGRECCVRNTEVCINNFFLSLYVHHANRKIPDDNFTIASIQCRHKRNCDYTKMICKVLQAVTLAKRWTYCIKTKSTFRPRIVLQHNIYSSHHKNIPAQKALRLSDREHLSTVIIRDELYNTCHT